MSPRRQFCVAWLVCTGVLFGFPFVCAVMMAFIGDPSLRNPYADSMLTACQDGNTKVVQIMLHQGADVNAPVWEDTTPLMQASVYGHLDTVKVLLAAGADVNARTSHGHSVLVRAESSCARDEPQIIALLKLAGAKE